MMVREHGMRTVRIALVAGAFVFACATVATAAPSASQGGATLHRCDPAADPACPDPNGPEPCDPDVDPSCVPPDTTCDDNDPACVEDPGFTCDLESDPTCTDPVAPEDNDFGGSALTRAADAKGVRRR